MFRISFGANNNDSKNVNRNSMLVAPSILAPSTLVPGFYTVTLIRTDAPYIHWIKMNMPSTMKSGSDVLVYEPPLSNPEIPPPVPMTFVATIWKQTTGRKTPPPRAPRDRVGFSVDKLDKFAKRHGLVEVVSRKFTVKP